MPQAVKLYSTPHADFSYNYNSSCSLPLTVDFTDLSTNNDSPIGSWLWSIEDTLGNVINTNNNKI